MYIPNEHLDFAHQRLHHVTSDEVNAGALLQHLSAPAHSYDTWQPLPHGLSSLPTINSFAMQHAFSLPPETYGSTNLVDADNGDSFGSWETEKSSLQNTAGPPQHHLPTQPLRSNGWHPLFPRISDLSSAQQRGSPFSYHSQLDLTRRRSVPHGLPLSLADFFPQTRAHLASNGIPVDTSRTPIWNTDGTGGGYEGRRFQDQSQRNFFPQTQLPDYPARNGAPSVQPPIHQFALPQAVQSRRASTSASPLTLANNYGQSTQLPIMQEWCTDILTRPSKPSRRLPDAATRRKQEKCHQKGEARRKTIAAGTAENRTEARRPLASSGTAKLKPVAPPCAKRRKFTNTVAPQARRSPQLESFLNSYQSPYNGPEYTEVAFDCVQSQDPVYQPPIIELSPPAPDELPQAIVGKYEDYEWSVYHYQLQPKGYDFAERWFHELFDTTLNAGFIRNGDRYSILVLHNAVNPFEYEPTPSSTITFGMYEYHWYQHNEIHWTTLAADQRHLFSQCIQAGWLVEKCKWTYDAKPTEKRFHRAYWLAANRQDMRGLLKRGPSDDKPHDLVEEELEENPDKDFSIHQADLTNEWDVTETEAVAAWRRVQGEIEALGEEFDACGPGWQHSLIANSEW